MENGGAAAAADPKGMTEPGFWLEWRARAAAYARAFGGLTREDREDVAAGAVERAYAALESYDRSRPFAPWFLTIVRRVALDAVARGREFPAGPERFEAEISRCKEAETAITREDEAAFVRDFVAKLSERDRELAHLIHGEDLRVGEAARILGIPAGTAKWRLHEIKKALKQAWEREYDEA